MTAATTATVDLVVRARTRRTHRRHAVMAILVVLILIVVATSLMVGHTFYPPGDVLRVILGEEVEGASFTVGVLRLPRVALAIVAGCCFGLGGSTFQTLLRNPLASPDIIGISLGASAAAAFGIVVLGMSQGEVAAFAILAGLGVALVVYGLSFRSGVVGTRLILIGIGMAAMLESAIAYILSKASEWDLQAALRWLAGSLNGATWAEVLPVVVALLIVGPLLLSRGSDLGAMRLGDDTAAGLGVRVERTRLLVIIAAVTLIAFATSAAGPIAFVAFLSGPIAARVVGSAGAPLLPAALIGTLLVLVGDLCGQWLFASRYPVGVVTGVLGAPYLVYLIIRSNRTGASL